MIRHCDPCIEPHIDTAEVATTTSQTRHGPNATETRPAHPSQRKEIRVIENEFVNNPGVVRKISKILMNAFHGSCASWKEVDEASRNELWTRFNTIYRWDPCTEKEVYDAWEARLRKNFRRFMAEVCDEAKKTYTEVTDIVFDEENYSLLAVSHHEGSTFEVLRLEEKLEQQREDGFRREIALRKEFEDQREDDCRE
ncbi:hypothetical protein Tco_0672003 [Tanacetum coccineum]